MIHPIEIVQEMGDDEYCGSGIPPAKDLVPEVEVGGLVESLVRLVEQDEVRPVQLAEHDVEFLLSSPGELCRDHVVAGSPAEQLREVCADRHRLATAHAVYGAEEAEVLGGGEIR